MADPTLEWINNPAFANALIAFAGLRKPPEREHRGIRLVLYAWWDGQQFVHHRMVIRSGPFIVSAVPQTTRYNRLVLEPLSRELLHYRIAQEGAISLGVFISRSDRKLYVANMAAHLPAPPIDPAPITLRIAPMLGEDWKQIHAYLTFFDRDIFDVLRTLKGWGWR